MRLKLTNGSFAEIDDEDLDRVQQITFRSGETWSGRVTDIAWSPSRRPRTTYVLGRVRRRRPVTLHRLLMNAPVGVHVDHCDGNGLNNRRGNLRLVTSQQNNFNRRPVLGKTTKGVDYQYGKYRAVIWISGKRIHLGMFRAAEEAQCAYNEAAAIHQGQFAAII